MQGNDMAKNAGFTLIEIAVALLILTLVLGGVMQYLNAQFMSARLSRINGDFEVIKGAAIGYAYSHSIPNGSEPVVAYTLASHIEDLKLPPDMQKDPWGNKYSYVPNAGASVSWASATELAFTLSSYGADGVVGNDDITRTVYESEVMSHIK